MSDAADELGRGKRELKSRMVLVDGQPVLRLNNYDLLSGEPSVFDRELGDGVTAEARTRYVPREPAPKRVVERRVPAPPSAIEQQRMGRNDEIKREKERGNARCRAVFLQEHATLFREFGARIPPADAASAALARLPGEREALVRELAAAKILEQPDSIKVPMRQYQLAGLRWLASAHAKGHSAILADEMGLGKTLQTIAFLAHLKFDLGVCGPHLVLCPLSVLSSWLTEFKRFCPALRVVKLHSSDMHERERLKARILNDANLFDVVVTTYEMAKSPNMQAVLAHRRWWRYLVIDEGHVIKNEHSQISQAVRSFHYGNALLLTGTPLQNNMHELWALLNFLFPDIFPEASAFDSAFKLNSGAARDDVDASKLARAHAFLQPLMLRRVKAEVEKGLPEKLETVIECSLSEMQLFWYKRLLLKDTSLLQSLEAEGAKSGLADSSGGDWKKLQSLMMQLRKVCNHPHLIPGADAASLPVGEGDVAESVANARRTEGSAELISASGKLEMLDRLLRRLHPAGHRAVVFSQFTSMLDILEEYCQIAGWRYCRLDGSTNRVQRTVDINSFNAPGSKIFLFLMSTRAGGLGINCQTADTCILYDSDWNPQPDNQAMARVHRIGQTKKVHVYRLVTAGTVEQRILQRAEKKLYLDRLVNQDAHGGSGGGSWAAGGSGGAGGSADDGEPDSSELLKALTFGAQCCFGASAGGRGPTEEELDAITDRSRTADVSVGALKGGAQHAASAYDATAVSIKLRELQGVVYGADEGAELAGRPAALREIDIGAEWRALVSRDSKRESKTTTTTEYVKGVGLVAVKKVNNYTMGEGMLHERPPARRKVEAGKQVAGRDYDHESHCLVCWDGGDLVCCDLCPAAYHPRCLGLGSADEIPAFGVWSCPHHSCGTCDRRSAQVGGLLFRCAVCPEARCEDHLMETALVVGVNDRYEQLGFRHPKQGCYVLCSGECKNWALSQGLAVETANEYATAAAIIGATGIDTTAGAAAAARENRDKWVTADTRASRDKLEEPIRRALDALREHSEATSLEVVFASGRPEAVAAAAQAAAAASAAGSSSRARKRLERKPLVDLPPNIAFFLHDFLCETELVSVAWANASARNEARDAALARICAWRGALVEGREEGPASATKRRGKGAAASPRGAAAKKEQETLAAFFLNAQVALENETPHTVLQIARALKLRTVSQVGGAHPTNPAAWLANPATNPPHKKAAAMIALVLAHPVERALYLRAEGEARRGGLRGGASAVLPLVADPEFDWTLLTVSAGRIARKAPASQPAPRPPTVTPPRSLNPVAPSAAPAMAGSKAAAAGAPREAAKAAARRGADVAAEAGASAELKRSSPPAELAGPTAKAARLSPPPASASALPTVRHLPAAPAVGAPASPAALLRFISASPDDAADGELPSKPQATAAPAPSEAEPIVIDIC